MTYIGGSLTDAEKKYSTTEIESLSSVWCIEKLHLYLYQKKFNVRFDYRPLLYIFGPKSKTSARMERWQLRLQPYDFLMGKLFPQNGFKEGLARMNHIVIY